MCNASNYHLPCRTDTVFAPLLYASDNFTINQSPQPAGAVRNQKFRRDEHVPAHLARVFNLHRLPSPQHSAEGMQEHAPPRLPLPFLSLAVRRQHQPEKPRRIRQDSRGYGKPPIASSGVSSSASSGVMNTCVTMTRLAEVRRRLRPRRPQPSPPDRHANSLNAWPSSMTPCHSARRRTSHATATRPESGNAGSPHRTSPSRMLQLIDTPRPLVWSCPARP